MNPFKWLFNKYIDWAFTGYEQSWQQHKRIQRIRKLQRKAQAGTKRI
jgi:hypothetical protein